MIRATIYLDGGGAVPVTADTIEELSAKIERMDREVLAQSIILATTRMTKVERQRDSLAALVSQWEMERCDG